MDSNFRTFWLPPVTRNILGYSLFCERKEKWRVVSRKFQKKKLKQYFFIHLVNTKTTILLRVGEKRWICTSTLCVSVYIHHYSPRLRGIVVLFSVGQNWCAWNFIPRVPRFFPSPGAGSETLGTRLAFQLQTGEPASLLCLLVIKLAFLSPVICKQITQKMLQCLIKLNVILTQEEIQGEELNGQF